MRKTVGQCQAGEQRPVRGWTGVDGLCLLDSPENQQVGRTCVPRAVTGPCGGKGFGILDPRPGSEPSCHTLLCTLGKSLFFSELSPGL